MGRLEDLRERLAANELEAAAALAKLSELREIETLEAELEERQTAIAAAPCAAAYARAVELCAKSDHYRVGQYTWGVGRDYGAIVFRQCSGKEQEDLDKAGTTEPALRALIVQCTLWYQGAEDGKPIDAKKCAEWIDARLQRHPFIWGMLAQAWRFHCNSSREAYRGKV